MPDVPAHHVGDPHRPLHERADLVAPATSSHHRGSAPRRRSRSAGVRRVDLGELAPSVYGSIVDRVVLARVRLALRAGRSGSSAGTAPRAPGRVRVAKTSAVHSWTARSAKSLRLSCTPTSALRRDDPPAGPQRRPPLPGAAGVEGVRALIGSPRSSALVVGSSSVTSSSPMSVSPPTRCGDAIGPPHTVLAAVRRGRTTAGCRRRRPRRRGGTCPRSGTR